MRGDTFIVSDPTPVTVPDLVARYRIGLGRSPWLIPVPEKWLELALKAAGQSATWERLGRPLLARPAKLIGMGWKPGRAAFRKPSEGGLKPIRGRNIGVNEQLARPGRLPYLAAGNRPNASERGYHPLNRGRIGPFWTRKLQDRKGLPLGPEMIAFQRLRIVSVAILTSEPT